MKVYAVKNEIYANREDAENRARIMNYGFACGGCPDCAEVTEVEVITEKVEVPEYIKDFEKAYEERKRKERGE